MSVENRNNYPSHIENEELIIEILDVKYKNEPRDHYLTYLASKKGHFKVLKWLIEQKCPIHFKTFKNTVKRGETEILKLILSQKYVLNHFIFENAARYCNLEFLKWLKEKNCSWSEWTFRSAAIHGDLETLMWLKEQGCPWNIWTFTEAAKHYNFEMIKFLKEQGCPWDKGTFKEILKHGHLNILKWLKQHDCLFVNRKTINIISERKSYDILVFFDNHFKLKKRIKKQYTINIKLLLELNNSLEYFLYENLIRKINRFL